MLDTMRRYKAGIFQALAHPTRVAIVEYLRHGEMSVGKLCEKIGVEQANASQHLSILRSKNLVETRKAANLIFYRLRDPRLGEVLEIMGECFLTHLNEALKSLHDEGAESKARGAKR